MKKVFLGMAACAMLCACSSDDIVSIADQGAAYEGEAVYMTVRIKDVNSGTRATEGGYAYGSEDEQKVANAYFYFYDAEGEYMAKGSLGEVNGTAAEETTPGNVEWESDTQVAVWGLTKSNLPTQMITVLNQPSGVDLTRKDLTTALATLAGTPYADGSGNFVMSNSVYYDGGIVNTTALADENFAPEPVNIEEHYGEEGSYTAVDVYVERLAAKVGMNVNNDILWQNGNQGGKLNVEVTDFENWPKQPSVKENSDTYVIQLLGFDVDCVTRDAKLVKNIDFGSSWANTPGFTGWNEVGDCRCFWAESTAYGDETVTYPASNWKGNNAEAEDTDPLNEYLRYVDLKEPATLGTEYVYCGENTNTADVIKADNDSNMNCLTQVLMKAQFGYENNNTGEFTPVDIVKYHGEYLTLADFEEDMIAEVEKYDFSNMVDEVADALGSSLGQVFTSVVNEIIDALVPEVYMKKTEGGTEYEPFDSRFLQLYSQNDGRVSIWFDTDTSEDVDGNTNANHSDTYKQDRMIPAWYTQTTLVKEATESMNDYDFYIMFNESIADLNLFDLLKTFGFVEVEEGANGEGEYYLPLNGLIKIKATEGSSANTYDARNFLIRCIEREAAGIVDDWSESGFPYFYNEGLMYYNVPIEHLASKATTGGTVYPDASGVVEAQYGVVRNHWYDITVTSVSDFGHAIADPEEVIVPQVEEDYYYLGADINILSWKMVSQEVGF